mmetsp:Transcript_146086/g.407002  ORF Transcript_146086/g.407002 Transcript_146086/m.407002 type:complete len:213 (+) Transcript_146086:155-793(+)
MISATFLSARSSCLGRFNGAMPRSSVMSMNSSKLMVPFPSTSYWSKNVFIFSSSMFSAVLTAVFSSAGGGTYGAGSSSEAMNLASCAATVSTNCSVVRPVGPHRSRVPLPSRKAANTASLHERVNLFTAAFSLGSSAAAWSMASRRATTMPSGFIDVSSPRKWACQRSATVPWDASNSLMRVPSSFLPTRFEVMKPGLRWTWATSSVSMSPS